MSKKGPNHFKFYYFTGFFTAVFIFLLLSLFLGYKIGFSKIFAKLSNTILPQRPYHEKVLDMPGPILKELFELDAVIEYAGDPIKHVKHDTILARPDKELNVVLKENVKIAAWQLKTRPNGELFSFYCPPGLYLDAKSGLSEGLSAYIRDNSRISYSYSTDKNGFRTTTPIVESKNKILIIGDSVAFGAGVSDQFTIASFLQEAVGSKFQIVNAGVGDYSWREAVLVAKKESLKNKYSCLIYIACQNDFVGENSRIEDIFKEIKSIEKDFGGKVIIFFHTYMQYCLRDMLPNNMGWPRSEIENTSFLSNKVAEVSKRLNFEYCDWEDIADKFMEKKGSLFSRFSLYVDHCHLSPQGNRLAAQELYHSLRNLNILN